MITAIKSLWEKKSKNEKNARKKTKKISNQPNWWNYCAGTVHYILTSFINATNTNTTLSCDEIAQKRFRMIYYRIECLRCLFSFHSYSSFYFFFQKKIVLFFLSFFTNTSLQSRRDWTFGMRLYASGVAVYELAFAPLYVFLLPCST